MAPVGNRFRLQNLVVSRTGRWRRFGQSGPSSDRSGGAIPGRQARHDGIAMCLLRKDIAHAMPIRQAQRVARNRRMLIFLWIFVVLWWAIGWFRF